MGKRASVRGAPVTMADSDAEDKEVAITESHLDKLKKWERTRKSPLSDSLPAVCSLVAIRDYSLHKSSGDSTVFPPVNHENLYISTNSVHKTHSQSSSPPFPSSPSLSSSLSSSSFSPYHLDNDDSFAASDCNVGDPPNSVQPDTPRPPAKTAGYRGRWLNFGLQLLLSRVNGIVMFRRCFTSARLAVTSIFSPYGVAAMLVLFGYFRWRRRLITRQSGEQMRRTIREKDERINQLLSQLAEMNQVLLAMNKGNLPKN